MRKHDCICVTNRLHHLLRKCTWGAFNTTIFYCSHKFPNCTIGREPGRGTRVSRLKARVVVGSLRFRFHLYFLEKRTIFDSLRDWSRRSLGYEIVPLSTEIPICFEREVERPFDLVGICSPPILSKFIFLYIRRDGEKEDRGFHKKIRFRVLLAPGSIQDREEESSTEDEGESSERIQGPSTRQQQRNQSQTPNSQRRH